MNNILMQHLKIILSNLKWMKIFFHYRGWQLTISRILTSLYVRLQWNEVCTFHEWKVLIIVTVCCTFKIFWELNFDGNKTFHKHEHDVEMRSYAWVNYYRHNGWHLVMKLCMNFDDEEKIWKDFCLEVLNVSKY